jgi:predicted TIM-barrel enzyme
MALDLNLLYGEMFASAIIHGTIPYLIYFLTRNIPSMSHMTYILVLLGACSFISFLLQFGLLTALQANSCKGVKDFSAISIGAAIAAVITAAMLAIPAFSESMRLMVSSLIIKHNIILNPSDAENEKVLIDAAQKITGGVPGASFQVQPTDKDIEDQTRREIAIGAGYWGIAAGAYGIGLGTMFATPKC